jgi:hypothetical protein
MKPFVTVDPVGEVLISQVVTAGPGDYTLSGYSKWEPNFKFSHPELEAILQLEYLDASENVIDTDVVNVKNAGQMADNTWRQFTLEGTAPAGTVEIKVTAGATGMDANEEMTSTQSAFWDDLVLEMDIVVPPGLPGDFNEDDKVDAADYVKWRKDGANPLPNDGGAADMAARFALWKANFGEMAMPGGGSGGTSAVPEPGCLVLALMALVFGAAIRRR